MNTANSFETWTNRLAERPEIYPHQLNLINDTLLLVELSSSEVNAASFLDQRVLKQSTKGAWIPWQLVADIFDMVPKSKLPGFIFHVGHCGSTLLSRLLEFAEDTRSIREPLPLRTLAQDLADFGDGRSFLTQQARLDRLRILSQMWDRGSSHTVVKATSICTDLLPQLNSLEPGARSIFIYNGAETHIATLLAGQNALIDLKGFAQLRLQRLRQISGLDIQLNQLSTGQLAALSWLSETTSATRSLEKHPKQIALLDFESLLQNPTDNLARLLGHLNIHATSETVEKAVRSPVLQTYSKAPEHKYNAQTRATILQNSRARFGQDIKSALSWLESLADQSELVALTLQKFA
jgi:hypothetical protein